MLPIDYPLLLKEPPKRKCIYNYKSFVYTNPCLQNQKLTGKEAVSALLIQLCRELEYIPDPDRASTFVDQLDRTFSLHITSSKGPVQVYAEARCPSKRVLVTQHRTLRSPVDMYVTVEQVLRLIRETHLLFLSYCNNQMTCSRKQLQSFRRVSGPRSKTSPRPRPKRMGLGEALASRGRKSSYLRKPSRCSREDRGSKGCEGWGGERRGEGGGWGSGKGGEGWGGTGGSKDIPF